MTTHLLIPMAGRGKRFLAAGYETFKPFIPVGGRPMVEHVLRRFPPEVRKTVIVGRGALRPEQHRLLTRELECEVVEIDPHTHGPGYSLWAARERIASADAYFFSYCDISWDWDFGQVERGLDADGVVYTHQGFHPHLVRNGNSAFCRPDPADPTRMAEIREKGCFTADWMNEPLSCGMFYVRRGADLVEALEWLVASDQRVNNELFPSLLFNRLVARGRRVSLEPVTAFVHYGLPEQLRDLERWGRIAEAPAPAADAPWASDNVVCMAGSGTRLQKVVAEPKALTPLLGGLPMFEHASRYFPARARTLITSPTVGPRLRVDERTQVVTLREQTRSQFATLLAAADTLAAKNDFFLTSCDAYGLFDRRQFELLKSQAWVDAVLFTFRPSLLQTKLAGHYTHVSLDGGRVTAVHVKSRSSPEDVGLAGFFWVRRGEPFARLGALAAELERPGQPEPIVDSVFAAWVREGLGVAALEAEPYVHVGTAEELAEYNYWLGRGRSLLQASGSSVQTASNG